MQGHKHEHEHSRQTPYDRSPCRHRGRRSCRTRTAHWRGLGSWAARSSLAWRPGRRGGGTEGGGMRGYEGGGGWGRGGAEAGRGGQRRTEAGRWTGQAGGRVWAGGARGKPRGVSRPLSSPASLPPHRDVAAQVHHKAPRGRRHALAVLRGHHVHRSHQQPAEAAQGLWACGEGEAVSVEERVHSYPN